MARVEATYAAKRTLPLALRLTRNHVHVAAKLAFWRSASPRMRDLARAARLSISTVKRALARLRGNGLLSWTRRVLYCRGWRAMIASAYALLSSKPVSYQGLRSSLVLTPPGDRRSVEVVRAPATDLLLARRQVIERRLQAARGRLA